MNRQGPKAAPLEPKRQPYYCEENVWHLCQEPALAGRSRYVIFISNTSRACPMWNQRAGRGRPIVWDYHVILLAAEPLEIWDVDTTLGLPVPALDYLTQSFRDGLPELYAPSFRLVPADVYVKTFASDRAHMRDAAGKFRKPPPPWPVIGGEETRSNLMDFVEMERTFVGEVISLGEMRRRAGSGKSFTVASREK